jgi:hypothetical protein
MEAENTKVRNATRKEYTNNVRSLASFVKKRDPRYVAYEAAMAQKRQDAEELKIKQKAEELQARKEKRERIREEYAKNTEEIESRDNERKGAFLLADVDSDEEDRGVVGKVDSDDERQVQKSIKKVSLDDYIAGRGAGEGGDGDEDGGDGAGDGGAFACALCSKEFKTEAQLTQHNASKPHRKKVQETAKSLKKGGGKEKGAKEADKAT